MSNSAEMNSKVKKLMSVLRTASIYTFSSSTVKLKITQGHFRQILAGINEIATGGATNMNLNNVKIPTDFDDETTKMFLESLKNQNQKQNEKEGGASEEESNISDKDEDEIEFGE